MHLIYDPPADYCNQMGILLELIYQTYTEFNSVEVSEFKAIIDPLDKQLRSFRDTIEEADEYIVFEIYAAYEKQSYIEGLKVGTRLMMELVEIKMVLQLHLLYPQGVVY